MWITHDNPAHIPAYHPQCPIVPLEQQANPVSSQKPGSTMDHRGDGDGGILSPAGILSKIPTANRLTSSELPP
jgi:hypothetical protein